MAYCKIVGKLVAFLKTQTSDESKPPIVTKIISKVEYTWPGLVSINYDHLHF